MGFNSNPTISRSGFSSSRVWPQRNTWLGVCILHGVRISLCSDCGGRRASTGRHTITAAPGACNTREGWTTEEGYLST